ncbi:MAG TPA: cytochrome c3 family protein [Longimicrobiales bacterium]|nr:cytochrome c3 family protein [Longimicrobiales bacterium]
MGRRVLLSLCATLLLGGCERPETARPRAPDDPHRDVACADCHSGALVQASRAATPPSACTASGCHADGGPRVVELRSISFQHRGHGGDTTVATACAGCHTHLSGLEPLSATVEPCALCHLSEQSAGNAGECRLCHTNLEYTGETSQGIDLPHQGLPWMDGGCVRCHYDVTEAPVDVRLSRCTACHADSDRVVAQGIGEDLHLGHTGVSCLACHEDTGHRIRAMSTAVVLECSQCHQETHGMTPAPEWPGTETCNACHGGTHREQQALVLGTVAGSRAPLPSDKFLEGLTCRSCHLPLPGEGADTPVEASGEGCVSCHRPEYGRILQWWREGSTARVARVEAALTRARVALAAERTAAPQLDTANALLAAVREGGAPHNLRLSHRLLVDAGDRISAAYGAAGRPAPTPPDLGREPAMGLCTYCHYRLDDPWVFRDMSGEFHRDALSTGGR